MDLQFKTANLAVKIFAVTPRPPFDKVCNKGWGCFSRLLSGG